MPHRIAFVVDAAAGQDLRAGAVDSHRVHSLLVQARLGECDPAHSLHLSGCPSRYEFEQQLHKLLRGWDASNQLVFYFSGHGELRNGLFSLVFGSSTHATYLTYSQLADDLASYGVTRAILIIDSCHSGAIHTARAKGDSVAPLPEPHVFPHGVAVLTSCQRHEKSYELVDRPGSLFTTLLAEALESGLGGKPTSGARITVDDAVTYIRERLQSAPYSAFAQKPSFSATNADASIWLANNISGTVSTARTLEVVDSGPQGSARTYGELKVLYEATAPSQRPCPGPSAADLSMDIVKAFADKIQQRIADDPHTAARALGLYSAISPSSLTQAAVLCFAARPQRHIPHARVVLHVGAHTEELARRVDIDGPLAQQVVQVTNELERISMALHPLAEPSLSLLRAHVIREAISNAIVHRPYDVPIHIQVMANAQGIRICNPGRLLNGRSWHELVAARVASTPHDAVVSWYLTHLLQFEGIGRGFSKFREYLRRMGREAIECREEDDPPCVELVIRSISEAERGNRTTVMLDSAAILDGGSTAHRASFGPVKEEMLPDRIGRYHVKSLLGRGGMGSVYLAVDDSLGREVALKVMNRRYWSADVAQRFEREAKSAARLQHAHIAAIYDYGLDGEWAYIAMAFVRGKDLTEWIKAIDSTRRVECSVRIMMQVASTVAFVHSAGFVHRDIKPSNIIVTPENVAKLIDFGIARAMEEVTLTELTVTVTGAVIGTPAYMSPEQVAGASGSVGPASDIYAMGVVLYELLYGERPFGDHSGFSALAAQIRHGEPRYLRDRAPVPVPTYVKRVWVRAMAREPERRYASAREMAGVLEKCLQVIERGERQRQRFKRVLRWLLRPIW